MSECICGNSNYVEFRRYVGVGDDDLLGISCACCQQEWLRQEYLSNQGENRLNFGNVELRQQNRPPTEIQTAFQVKGSRTRIDLNNLYCLQAGDHIAWHRPYIIWHHAIFLEVDTERRMVRVVHWNKVHGRSQVIKQWLSAENQLGDLFRIDYSEEIVHNNPPRLVLARARSRLGEVGFHLLENNCEELAAFCKTGAAESWQVKWFREKLKEVTCTTIGQFVKTITKAVCVCVKETVKAGGASITTKEASKIAGKTSLTEIVVTVQHASNLVGAGIVIAIEGVFCIKDLIKIYNNRKKCDDSRKIWVESISQRTTEAILGAEFTIAGSLIGELAGGVAGAAIGNVISVFWTVTGATVGLIVKLAGGPESAAMCYSVIPGFWIPVGATAGLLIGSIIGGVVGSLIGKVLGSAIGPCAGKIINHLIG